MSKFDYKRHLQNMFGGSSAIFDKYLELWMTNIELFLLPIKKIYII